MGLFNCDRMQLNTKLMGDFTMANLVEYLSEAHQLMSFATVADKHPSVRTVGFGYDEAEPGVFYIVTKPESTKVSEIEGNGNVAFSTFPGAGGKRVSTNQAVAKVSDKPFSAIAHLFADNAGWKSGHPHPEEETILEVHVKSVLLESFVEAPESITF